jgi:ABC-type phosphate transport system, periplasmic component
MKKIATYILLFSTLIIVLTGCNRNSEFDENKSINAITREEGSGTRGAFVELLNLEEKQADGSKKDLISKDIGVESNTNTILTTVQNNIYAIGYISMGSLNENVKTLQIDGIDPTTENIKNGTYKISCSFNIAIKNEENELVKDFIDFIISKEGQEIVNEKYIAINDNATPYIGNKPSGTITIGGSSSIAPLMEDLIEMYTNVNPNANIQLQISDSSTGMTQTIEGVYDIGMASRELKDSEKAELKDLQIALDGIAIIINKKNPITNINQEDIRKIYLGEIDVWNNILK